MSLMKVLESGQKANKTKSKSQLKIEQEYLCDYEIKMRDRSIVDSTRKDLSGSGLSRRQSAINSTAKYREKKKNELGNLEQDVRELQNEMEQLQKNINNMKKKITVTIETLTKVNQLGTNENVEIYHEMQILLGKSDEKMEIQTIQPIFGNFSKFNLLLDTLKYRIGASGRERQGKLSYQFRSIVNTMFPALCRYIMFSCVKKIDFFRDGDGKPIEWEWTNQLCKTITLTEEQLEFVRGQSDRLINVYNSALDGVDKLERIKEKFIQEGIVMEGTTDQIRELINPIQCAHWTLFAEKNKYRKQILLDAPFFHVKENFGFQDDLMLQRGMKGKKKVKLSP